MTKINQRAQALAQPKTPTSKNAVKAPSENKTLVPQLEDRFDESYNPYFDDDQTPFQTAIIGTLASSGLGAIGLVATTGWPLELQSTTARCLGNENEKKHAEDHASACQCETN